MALQRESIEDDLVPGPHFRETEPIRLWSGRLVLSLPYDEFHDTVLTVARRNEQRYTGFITKDSRGFVTSFTRSRYPRKKYGVTPIQECISGMNQLASALGGRVSPEPQRDGFRVVMGLVEGYNKDAPHHEADEVQHRLPRAIVWPAEVFAVRLSHDGPSVYTEPVAIIQAHRELLSDVYQLGDQLRQERFTVEDFDRGLTYAVETRYCREPD